MMGMRELRTAKLEGRIYLFPVPVVVERKYLIFCSSEAEATSIAEAVKAKTLTHPDLISEHFIFLTLHTDKQTKIFVLNPKCLI
jgi:hypothetical protein